MSVGYTRQSAGTILTGNTIQASDFNAEYNLLESAFGAVSGHNHDGTIGGGAKIPVAGLSGLTNTSAGIMVADGANGYVLRTLTAPAAGITITNGTGVSGNPTLVLANDLAGLEGLATNGVAVRTGTSTWTTRTITGTAGKITVTNGDGVSGAPTLTIDSGYIGQNTITTLGTIVTGVWNGTAVGIAYGGTGQTTANAAFNALAPSQATNSGKFLTTNGTDTSWATVSIPSAGLADPGGNGVVVRTALNTTANRTITAGSNISVTNGDGVAGNPTIAVTGIGSTIQGYDATLASLAAYNTNGLLTQTAADTFTGRTITGTTNRLDVSNGNGVSGNPTLDISSSYVGQATITTLGTITTGTWTGTTIARANGGTGLTTAGTLGNILTSDGTNWVSSPPANTGTVTSVATSGGITGGTITATGTISIDTNNSIGIGAYALLRFQVSGGSVVNSSTVSGANLEIVKFSTTGAITASGNPSGTWRNVSGTTLTNGGGTNGEYGMFIRTA